MTNRIEISSIIRRRTLGLTFVLGAASFAFAQQKVNVTGNIVTKQNVAVPYASVTFSNKADKLFSDATLTDEKGAYQIPLAPGNYDITIEAIDFKKATINKQIAAAGNLGSFSVEAESSITGTKTSDIQGVVITATTKPVKVEIDKKVYDVKSDLTAIGGNSQDVLQNVPSVSVDPDGTVSMRGSSNVKFLVNGKPSALLGIDDGANALQAIPADQIDRIEVITNPSAKYDASGTAGILNIILKKTTKMGFNGSVVGSLGFRPRTSLNTNLSWKKGGFNWFVNGGGGYTENKGKNWTDTNFTVPNTDGYSHIYQLSNNNSTSKNYNGTAGIVYELNDKTSINASGTIRNSTSTSNSPVNYFNYDTAGNLFYGLRNSTGNNKNTGMQGDFGLDHKLDDKGQNISISLSLQKNKSQGDTYIDQSLVNVFQLSDKTNQKTTNKSTVGKIDYELPIGENSFFNAGYKVDLNRNDYDFGVVEKKATDIDYAILPRYNSTTNYEETINAAYLQFKSKIGNFGYQLGVRDELSNININYKNLTGNPSEQINDKKKSYNGLFPSVFLSYNFSKDNQLLLNYSRRIDRPRSFFLVPFMSYTDNQNIFRGNVDLDPAYIDSFEFGYNLSKKKFTLNPTLYFRNENNDVKMTVAYVYDSFEQRFVFNTTPLNLGYDRRYGLDLNYSYDPFKWLKIAGEIDLYGYKTSGEYHYSYQDPNNASNTILKNISYDGNGFSNRLRLTTTFKFDKTFSLQLQGQYRGKQVEGANDQKAMYFMNMGATKTLWKGDGTIAFNMQDVFNTRARKVSVNTADYTQERYMQWQPQQVSLSLTYRFKQGEKIDAPKRKKDINNNDSGEDQHPPM
jgi:outer membrane receptor protein involved in Fe transport